MNAIERMRVAVRAIENERDRQERLKAEGRFPFTCADPQMLDGRRLSILTEELGEVARAQNERDDGHTSLTEGDAQVWNELVEVAAVATAWLEYPPSTGSEATVKELIKNFATRILRIDTDLKLLREDLPRFENGLEILQDSVKFERERAESWAKIARGLQSEIDRLKGELIRVDTLLRESGAK